MEFESFESFEEMWMHLNELSLEFANDKEPDIEYVNTNIDCINNKCCNTSCDGTSFNKEDHETICKKCGTVQSKVMDSSAEWRYYGYDDNKSSNPIRCGMPENHFTPKSSLGTVIGNENSSKFYHQYSRIRKYHMWNSMPYKERSLFTILNNMNINAGNSGLSQTIIDDAKVYYKKISEKKISRGENRNGLIASSIYMSCKSNKVPRSAKEIAKMFNLNITTMTKGCKSFYEIMNITLDSTTPTDFIRRFCSKLNHSEIIDLCLHIVKKSEEHSIVCENAPPSIAAGIIYLCSVNCNLKINKKDISKACQISEVTINKCFKKLNEFRLHIFPSHIIEKHKIK